MPSINVIAIIGIVATASVLAAIVYFQPTTLGIAEKEPFTKVTIDGLKEAYNTGEPIDFLVRVEGFGCDMGFPHVMIEGTFADSKGSPEEIVWSRFGEIRLFPAGYSCPHEDINHVRHIGDSEKYNNDEQERLRTEGSVPISIDREGIYAVQVQGGNVHEPFIQEFEVRR